MADVEVQVSSTARETFIAAAAAAGTTPIGAQEANSFYLDVISMAEVCAQPLTMIEVRTTDGTTTATIALPKVSGKPIVGTYWDTIRRLNPREANLTQSEIERRRYALALAWVVRSSANDPRQSSPTGWVLGPLATVFTVVAVSAVAAYVINNYVRVQDATERVRIAQAGAEYVERLRQYRQTGTMPPASATEQAAAAAVTARSNQTWDSWGLGQAATTTSKWVTAAIGLGLAWAILKK
jgi:hypothetical protein